MARAFVDMTGQRFGRLICRWPTKSTKSGRYWLCTCDCHGVVEALRGNLTSGKVASCGCLQKESRKRNGQNTIHGHASRQTLTYTSWEAMNARCNNPNADYYYRYGGRGITICERWRNYENFLTDMGERPVGMTIDRKDVNGNYEPDNCRWATALEQANNK